MSNKSVIAPSTLPELLQKRSELQNSLLEKTQSLRDVQQSVDTNGSDLEAVDAQIRAIEAHQAEQQRLSELDATGKEAREIADRINAATQIILTEYPRLAQLLTGLPSGAVSNWYDFAANSGKLPVVFHDSTSIEIQKLQALEGSDRAQLRAKYPAIAAQFSK